MNYKVLNDVLDAFREKAAVDERENENGIAVITIIDVNFVASEITFAKADENLLEIQENGAIYCFSVEDITHIKYNIE